MSLDQTIILVIGMVTRHFPLRSLNPHLRLCLPCLPYLLRLFLNLSLRLGPCLRLLTLSLCSFGLRLGYDINGGIFCCSLCVIGFLRDSRLCLGLYIFTRLSSEPGDLRLLLASAHTFALSADSESVFSLSLASKLAISAFSLASSHALDLYA